MRSIGAADELPVGGLVLAAGEGRRFGGIKQLAEFDGMPLLEHPLRALATSEVDRVVVVLGAYAAEILRRVDLHGAEVVICEIWQRGQGESLRRGVEALGHVDAVVVVLGDQPGVSPAAIARVLAARGTSAMAVRATYEGVPGHPVVLERAFLPRLRALHGNVGAREVLDQVSVREVPCGDVAGAVDVDTPADLRALERGAKNITNRGER